MDITAKHVSVTFGDGTLVGTGFVEAVHGELYMSEDGEPFERTQYVVLHLVETGILQVDDHETLVPPGSFIVTGQGLFRLERVDGSPPE